MSARKIPLTVQIQEVRTELKFRAEVFPRQAQQQPRKRAELDYRMEIMRAVLATLEWLAENEGEVREIVAAAKVRGESDSQYIAGLKEGFRLGLAGNHGLLNEIVEKRMSERAEVARATRPPER